VLEEALSADLMPTPRKAATSRIADTSKHCRFHQNYGHTTKECLALMDRIEELIQAGHLRQFVRNQFRTVRRQRSPERRESRGDLKRKTEERTRTPCPTSSQPPGPSTCVKGVINTIAGRFASGGSSASAIKKHLRAVQSTNAVSMPIRRRMPPITFTNTDFKGIDPFRDDPMVITVKIENFSVMKTLVDQGSLRAVMEYLQEIMSIGQ